MAATPLTGFTVDQGLRSISFTRAVGSADFSLILPRDWNAPNGYTSASNKPTTFNVADVAARDALIGVTPRSLARYAGKTAIWTGSAWYEFPSGGVLEALVWSAGSYLAGAVRTKDSTYYRALIATSAEPGTDDTWEVVPLGLIFLGACAGVSASAYVVGQFRSVNVAPGLTTVTYTPTGTLDYPMVPDIMCTAAGTLLSAYTLKTHHSHIGNDLLRIARSTDGGLTWTQRDVVGGPIVTDRLNNSGLFRGPGSRIVVMNDIYNNSNSLLGLSMSYSDDDGLSWSAPQVLPGIYSTFSGDIVGLPNGDFIINGYNLLTSSDGCQTWTAGPFLPCPGCSEPSTIIFPGGSGIMITRKTTAAVPRRALTTNYGVTWEPFEDFPLWGVGNPLSTGGAGEDAFTPRASKCNLGGLNVLVIIGYVRQNGIGNEDELHLWAFDFADIQNGTAVFSTTNSYMLADYVGRTDGGNPNIDMDIDGEGIVVWAENTGSAQSLHYKRITPTWIQGLLDGTPMPVVPWFTEGPVFNNFALLTDAVDSEGNSTITNEANISYNNGRSDIDGGTDNLSFASAFHALSSDDFTISMVFKTMSGEDNIGSLLGCVNGNNYYFIYMDTNHVYVRKGTASNSAPHSESITDGLDKHLVFTRTGGVTKLYLNGVELSISGNALGSSSIELTTIGTDANGSHPRKMRLTKLITAHRGITAAQVSELA